MRGDARYASSKLAAFGPILSALAHFFECGDWTRPVRTLSKNARMYVLNQAAVHLSITKGFPAPEAKLAYELARREAEEAESVPDLFLASRGLWRCHHVAAEYEEAMRAADRLVEWSLETGRPLHAAEANFAIGATAHYIAEFKTARQHLERAIAAYSPDEPHSGMGGFDVRVASLAYSAWVLWYLGYSDTASERCEEALERARALSDHHTIALALHFSAYLAYCRWDGAGIERYADELLELSSRYGFLHWLACGTIMKGCASVMHGQCVEGIQWIRDGLEIWKSASAKLGLTDFIGKLAHAYAKAYERACGGDESDTLLNEALNLVEEGLRLSESYREKHYKPELYRIKGELAVLSAPHDPAEAADSFVEAESLFRLAVELARGQESRSLELRAVNSLSRLLVLRDRRSEAKELLSQTCRWFAEGQDTADYRQAQTILDWISKDDPKPPLFPYSL
jgi:hypothetical protein